MIDLSKIETIELQPIEDDYPEPVFDFSYPEDVIFYLIVDEDYQSVDYIMIINDSDIIGAATYDHGYGCGLDYTIPQIIDDNLPENVYVMEDMTGNYIRGDGWTTDDDMDFDYENLRIATPEESAMLYGCNFWNTIEEKIETYIEKLLGRRITTQDLVSPTAGFLCELSDKIENSEGFSLIKNNLKDITIRVIWDLKHDVYSVYKVGVYMKHILPECGFDIPHYTPNYDYFKLGFNKLPFKNLEN